MPFDGKTSRFITFMVDTEKNVKRSAVLASLKLTAARRLNKNPEVQQEIEKRLDKVHDYQARLQARAHALSVEYLDVQLMKAVKEGAAKGDDKALKLGYQRVGIFRDSEFMNAPQQPRLTDPNAPPPIFRAERITTNTVTERIESASPAALPPPKPPEILTY
jgi:hypothetical protein